MLRRDLAEGSSVMRNKSNHDVGGTNAIAGDPRFSLGVYGPWPRVLVAHWAWIALVTIAVTAGAAVLAEQQTPIYKAQAEVAVYPTSSAGGTALQSFVIGTEKSIASSGALLSIVSKSLLIPESTLKRGLSVSVPVDTDLLQISFSDPDPQVAQNVAEAVAETYVTYGTSKALPNASGSASSAASPAVQAAVITDAARPTSPVSPNRLLIVGVALILGLVLGIGVALIRDQMDDGLRGPLDLQTQGETPVLGQIPAFHRKRRSLADALIVGRNPSSAVAEAYRNLRTRVLQVAALRRRNMLLVTSPGREDKSTVAANLAAALALSGKKVILVSADLRWGRAQGLFGLDRQRGLANVVNGDATLADALRRTEVPGLQVLPSGQAYFDPSGVLQSTAFRNLLGQLRSEADFLVIDAPPVLASADTSALAELGAMILLVADARASTRAEVRAATQELGHVGDRLIGSVLDNVGRARRMPWWFVTVVERLTQQPDPLAARRGPSRRWSLAPHAGLATVVLILIATPPQALAAFTVVQATPVSHSSGVRVAATAAPVALLPSPSASPSPSDVPAPPVATTPSRAFIATPPPPRPTHWPTPPPEPSAPPPTPRPTPQPTPTDHPPTAILNVTPVASLPPLNVTADASFSWDTDGTGIVSYQFIWGDGLSTAPQASPKATHVYTVARSYTITVIVVDSAGLSSSASATVTVT